MNERRLPTAVIFWVGALGGLAISLPGVADEPNHRSKYSFTITDIGTLGGTFASVQGVDNSGQVTGFSSTENDAADHAFLYKNGTMTDLGSLGGAEGSISYGSNPSGEVVGFSYTPPNDNFGGAENVNAFIYSHGSMTDIGSFTAVSLAFAINDRGQVVGLTSPSLSLQPSYAFLYSNGAMTDLGVQGSAQAVNVAGEVAGYGTFPSGTHAFLYSKGVVTDLGTPSGKYSHASYGFGMNDKGEVVGQASAADISSSQAFLYRKGTMKTLGALSGTFSGSNIAWAINNSGWVVGQAHTVDQTSSHAILYADGKMMDLNSLIDPSSPLKLYVTLTVATGVNDHCWIVADGFDSRSSTGRAYLLKLIDKPGRAECDGSEFCAPRDAAGQQPERSDSANDRSEICRR
jgi:probable HAF family extracellular repeat protein